MTTPANPTYHDLWRLPKLKRHVLAAVEDGYNVRVEKLGPRGDAGRAHFDGKVSLNNWHILGHDPEFTEDRLIVVLYHEIGHIDHFRSLNLGLALGDPVVPEPYVDQTESELFAFQKSLQECAKIADDGDAGPLHFAVHFIRKRQASGEEDQVYQLALNRIVESIIWATMLERPDIDQAD